MAKIKAFITTKIDLGTFIGLSLGLGDVSHFLVFRGGSCLSLMGRQAIDMK
jgi:hypothetical protein